MGNVRNVGYTCRRALLFACAAALIVTFGFLFLRGRGPDRPNLVLIIIDTLRADHLGCYGYDSNGTPNIDELARSGVLFEHAGSHVPITLPAISAIMTSTLPPTNGVHYNEGFHLDESSKTLAEILEEEGYSTAAVVGAVVIDSTSGISQGFGRYDDDFGAFTCYQPDVKELKTQYDDTQRRAEEVTEKALALAGSMVNEGPFFLFAHYFDPHIPLDPPPPWSDSAAGLSPRSQERRYRLYDAEISYADEQVGKLIRGLDDLGIREKTLIVVTADHGEGLGDHGERTHGHFVYDQTVHVPLIFSMPGTIEEGLRNIGDAGHIDLLPTVLDILGVKWRGKHDFQGTSLYPFGEGRGSGFSYLECVSPYILYGWCGLRGIRNANWKYISAPLEELYDLRSDPREVENLIGSMPSVADSLREIFNEMISGIRIYSDASGKEMSTPIEDQLSDERREKLRALGYLGTTEKYTSSYEEMFDQSLPDPKEKLKEYRQASLSDATMRKGLARMEMGSLQSAIDYLENAIAKNARNVSAHYYLGLARMESGDYRGAAESFGRVLDINPTNIVAGLAVVDAELAMGDTAEAERRLEDVHPMISEKPGPLFLEAGLWGRMGELGRVEEVMSHILEMEPDNARARLLLGEYLLKDGDFEAALASLRPLEGALDDGDTLSPRLYYALGSCYYKSGNLADAERMFERVIALDENAAEAHNQLGVICDDNARYREAIDQFNDALALEPGVAEVHSTHGVSFNKMGHCKESIREFAEYLPHVADPGEKKRLLEFVEQMKQKKK